MYGITEFDEQANNKKQAMANLRCAYVLYRQGEETYGVLSGYQDTALKHGVTWTEIETMQGQIDETYRRRAYKLLGFKLNQD